MKFRLSFPFFRAPSAETLARAELEEAKRELLAAQRHHEWFGKMVEYHSDRIRRLSRVPGAKEEA